MLALRLAFPEHLVDLRHVGLRGAHHRGDAFWLGACTILTGILFPPWLGRCGFAIAEFARRGRDFALAGAAVAVALDDSGRIERCGIALFGLGAVPLHASAAETALTGSGADDVGADEVGRLAVDGLDAVPADLHASAEYRRHVGAVIVARAWQRAVQEARSA